MITGKTGPNSADSDTQSLSALVTGDPTPSIEWRRNGSPLTLDSRITSSSEIEGGGMRVTLTIAMVTAADRGVYELVAWNDGGEETKSWDVPVNCELPSSLLLFSSPSTVSPSLSLSPTHSYLTPPPSVLEVDNLQRTYNGSTSVTFTCTGRAYPRDGTTVRWEGGREGGDVMCFIFIHAGELDERFQPDC